MVHLSALNLVVQMWKVLPLAGLMVEQKGLGFGSGGEMVLTTKLGTARA